jgi:hypothetical protein
MHVDNNMSSHRVVKWFRDYADDIEAVNIHYALTVIDETPDWNHTRTTRYMPLVGESIRMKELRLPLSISDSQGRPCSRYTLHYYFEVCQGGDRQYSPLYSEEVVTGPTDGPGTEVDQSGGEADRD